MTAVANTSSKISQAQFDHYKKELDLNHDGKIDKADAQMAEQQAGDARVKGGFSMLIPIAGWINAAGEFKKAGEFEQKAKQIHDLISKQSDGVLDQNDVRKRTCNRSYRTQAASPVELPPQVTQVIQQRCDQFRQDLKAAPTPEKKNDVLDQIGQFFQKLADMLVKFFQKLIPFGDLLAGLMPKPAAKEAEQAEAQPKPLVAVGSSSSTSSTSSAAACGTKVTGGTEAQRTPYRSSLPGTEGLKEEITADWRQAGRDIAGLREKIRNCTDKDEKQMLMMDLQEKMNEQARFMELLNKIQKQSHDILMSIIRNIS